MYGELLQCICQVILCAKLLSAATHKWMWLLPCKRPLSGSSAMFSSWRLLLLLLLLLGQAPLQQVSQRIPLQQVTMPPAEEVLAVI
jgi:hypothetical protein